MFLSFSDGKIHYSDSGQGSVIVLLHGYLESSEIWQNFAKKLSYGFRVIAMDLPGHGLSDNYSETHSMEFMALALKALLDNEGIKEIFLIGHSMGGYITLAFLDLFPEFLSGYCLFHSHPLADAPETVEKRKKDISTVYEGNRDLMCHESVKKMYAASNLDRLSTALNLSDKIASSLSDTGIIAVLNGMITRSSRLNLVEDGKVPFLWILGALDNYINCEIIQQKVKLPSNAKVVILNNSGHMGFIEEEDQSVNVITEFVRNLTF